LEWDMFTHEELLQCYRGLDLLMRFQTEDEEQD
jgi:hypothetical protein